MWAAWMVACAPKQPPVEAPAPDAEWSEGPSAGPRNVLGQPPPEPLPPDTPGGGPLRAYLPLVRAQVNAGVERCLRDEAPTIAEPALVQVTIGADGAVSDVAIARPSGDPNYDDCLIRAFRSARLPAPPPEILDATGVLVPPPLAFRGVSATP